MIIAIDTGGTKTLVTSFLDNGAVDKSTKFPTPQNQADYTTRLQDALITQYGNETLIKAIVIAMPGVIENGIVMESPDHLPWMPGLDVRGFLNGLFDDNIPIIVQNDCTMGGLGAVSLLDSNPKPPIALYIAPGTGIGSGIIVNGKIDTNFDNSEAGQAIFSYKGIDQKWEKFASGSAIYRDYGKYLRDITDQQTWDEIAERLSRGFLALVPILQPDVVIIGGSIGGHFDKFNDRLQKILDSKLPAMIKRPTFLQAQHTEEVVTYGCYYYYVQNILPHQAAE